MHGHDERGYISAVALMVLVVLMMLGAAVASLATQHRFLAAGQYRQTRAYYTAEAGVEKALADGAFLSGLPVDGSGTLQDDYSDAEPYLNNVGFSGGLLSVAVTRKPDDGFIGVFRIYSTGRVGSDARVLKVEARVPLLSFSNLFHSSSGIDVAGGAVINGDVQAAGDLDLDRCDVNGNMVAGGAASIMQSAVEGDVSVKGNGNGNVFINGSEIIGDISTEGAVQINPSEGTDHSTISGDIRANIEVTGYGPIILNGDIYSPVLCFTGDLSHTGVYTQVDPHVSVNASDVLNVDFERLKGMATAIYDGDKTLNTSELNDLSGIQYVDGNVLISGAFSGSVVIVCSGNAKLSGLIGADKGTSLIILAGGDVTVDGDNNQLFIYAGGEVSLVENGSLLGAVMAQGPIEVGQNVTVNYTHVLQNGDYGTLAGRPAIRIWQEKYPVFLD